MVFVGNGYEEDYASLDVKGKTVLFLADVKNNTSVKSMGVLDRAIIAKNKGAICVLLIPNKYMPIYTMEKPIKYDDSKIPIFYITSDIVKKMLSIDTDTDAIGKATNIKLEGKIDLIRETNKSCYNVLGMVYGLDQSKTIVVSASLDSYGSLPDGRVANGAATNCASIGALCNLANYYVNNATPQYNILFVVFGAQAELREGANYFVNNYSNISQVIANIDLYDVGNPSTDTGIFNSVDKQYTSLHDAVVKMNANIIDEGEDVNYPFGNNYEFYNKGIASMFVRYGDNLDSLDDNAIQPQAITKVTEHIEGILFYLIPVEDTTLTFDASKVTSSYIASIDETLKVYETKYVKLYYEDNFSQAIAEAVKTIDKVYAEVIWWNYNPELPNEKVAVYCVNEWEEGPIVVNRSDKIGNGEQSGGYQSFKDFSLSIVNISASVTTANDMISTFAHEFNHVCANHSLHAHDSDSDTDNQEISGHVYAFTLEGDTKFYYLNNVKELNMGTILPDINWDEYTGMVRIPSDQWTAHYDKLASVEYYIWKTYGKLKCRDIQYKFYDDPRPSVKTVLETELGKSFEDIIREWYAFYH